LVDGRTDVLKIPAIAPGQGYGQIGKDRWHMRAENDVLNSAHEPLAELLRLKERMGSNAFSAQYQQEPLPADGSIVEWAWFRRYVTLPSDMRIVQSWDCASKAGEFNDYSVCMTWGVAGAQFYLLDVLRKRLTFPELLRTVEWHARAWNANDIIIEDSAAGTQVIQSMRFERLPRVPLPIAITPEKDKQTRLHAVSAIIEQGRVHLPTNAPWLEDFRVELIQFPFGRHDDQVDCLSQFLGRMQKEQRGGSRAEHRPMFYYK
jgi:predicted phage terminase large subunit-like protein